MAIKFNVDPYYDDFLKAGTDTLTPQEKYHKVLFRPGIAVQARELTQLQSILQNQVTQFGSHMFKEGSLVIPGGNAYNNEADYVKLSAVSTTVTSAMEGKHFADATGLRAKVVKAVAAVGSDLDTFYIVYQNSNGATNANKVFAANATGLRAKVVKAVAAVGSDLDTFYIVYQNSNGATNANKVFATNASLTEKVYNASSNSYDNGSVTATVTNTQATGKGALFTQERGVYYIRGHFVIVKAETLVLSKYTNNISFDVGFEITEAVTTSAEDASLNDNATGSPNYAAPGAHRYSIKTALKTQANYGTGISNFLMLIRIVSGTVQKQVRQSDYAVIEDTLARRTYDESGDYTVRPFRVTMKEDTAVNSPGDATKLAAAIEPSKAYVRGYEIQTLATTNLSVNKARAAALFEGASVSTSIGNFVKVTADAAFVGLPDITTFSRITLHGSTGGSGTGLGFARVRTIEKDGSVYKLFLFDIELAAGKAFSELRSVSDSTVSFGANVSLVNSKAVLNEPSRSPSVFSLPFTRVKTCDG